jgi:hypothetical protein
MSELNVTKEDILKEIDNAKKILATKPQFDRLINSQDFKDVILKGLCVDDAAQYNLMLNDPFTKDTLHRQANLLLLTAAGVNIWIAAKNHMFENAANSLSELEGALEEGNYIKEGE